MSDIKPVDILIKAREILADEKAWVREMWAFNPDTQHPHVMPGDELFAGMPCFCLHGAIYAAAKRAGIDYRTDPSDHACRIVSKIVATDYNDLFRYDPHESENYETAIHDFNDDSSVNHSDVLAVLDKAIAKARENSA